jgi:hypothetical protein
MKETAAIFMECSSSASPALVLNKFIKIYNEIGKSLEVDPWTGVIEWINEEKENFWEIIEGLNFMQFVDCLGVFFFCSIFISYCYYLPS